MTVEHTTRPIEPARARPELPRPLFAGWAPDAAAVVGIALALSFLLPARLVVAGLGAAGRPALVLGVAALVWWAVSRLLPGALPERTTPLVRVLLGFGLATVVGYGVAFARVLTPDEAVSSDRALLRYLGLLGLALAVAEGVRSRERLEALLRVLVLSAVGMGVVGALQYLAGYDLTPRLRLPGLRLNGALIEVGEQAPGFSRVAGTAGHYIEFGVLMALAVPLAVHVALHGETRVRRRGYAVCAAFLALCSFFSVSRTPVLAIGAVALLLLPAWGARGKVNALGVSALFVVVLQLVQPGLLGTIRSLFRNVENDPSVQGRTQDYAVVGPLIADRPFVGRGLGTYSPERYVLLDNQWLATLVESGIVGTAALALVLLVAIATAKRVGRWGPDARSRSLGHCLAAPLGAAVVVSFTFDSLSFPGFAVVVFVLVGAVAALSRLTGRPGPPRAPSGG